MEDQKMRKTLTHYASLSVLLLTALMVSFCSTACTQQGKVPSPTVQLTEASDTLDVTINLIRAADQAGLIKPQWHDAIAQAYVAAKAAQKQMAANVQTNPTQFQAAMSDFNSAMGALLAYRQQITAAATQPTTQATTQPATQP
jgi:hypothetical protein